MQTRQSRGDSRRNSMLKEAGLMELYKLEQNVVAIAQRNKQKYRQILFHDSNYHVLFYSPNDKLKTQKAFKKQLLLKQLDKLMDQETIFDKKLAQLTFINQLQSQQQQKILDIQLSPYQALRTVWAKHQKAAIQSNNSAQRLESLNWTIGIIKNTVHSMKQREENTLQSHPCQTQANHNQNYQKLLLNYNRSLMLNEELRQEIHSLHLRLQAKSELQTQLQQKLSQKEKQIKSLKKIKQLAEVDQKFIVAQLKQQIFYFEKKLQKLDKWKTNLQKTTINHSEQIFKLYFEVDHSNRIDEKLFNDHITQKNLSEILNFLTQNKLTNANSTLDSSQFSQTLDLSSLDQQNSQIIIPELSFTEPNDQSPSKKKLSTDRPLRTKNFEIQKFVGNRLGNLKFSKLPHTTNLCDEAAKKFVRKNPVLGNPRRLEPQASERYFEPVSNLNN